MTTWIMPEAAHARNASYHLGPRGLLAAIEAAGDPLMVLPWDHGEPFDFSPIPDFPDRDFVVHGGHSFLRDLLFARPDLASGIYLDEAGHGHDRMVEALGEMCLNTHAEVVSRDEAVRRFQAGERLFARPILGNKAFNGGVMTRKSVENMPDVPMIIAAPKEIIAEYRFIIADCAVVTGSQYRRDGALDVRIDVNSDCARFAEVAAERYAPLRIFTCDVAETLDGPRVVEYNSFSSSGLYACDARKIVKAVRTLNLGLDETNQEIKT